MSIENKLEDSELLKQKMQEGYQCVLQGRSVYQLKSNKEGIVSAVPWKEYPNLPIPFTKKGCVSFTKQSELSDIINNILFTSTIVGYL